MLTQSTLQHSRIFYYTGLCNRPLLYMKYVFNICKLWCLFFWWQASLNSNCIVCLIEDNLLVSLVDFVVCEWVIPIFASLYMISSLLPQHSYADRKKNNNSPTKDTQDSVFFFLCKLQYILILNINLDMPTYEVRCHILGEVESDVSTHVVETLLSPTRRNTKSSKMR